MHAALNSFKSKEKEYILFLFLLIIKRVSRNEKKKNLQIVT